MNDDEMIAYEQAMRESELRTSEARTRNMQQEAMLRQDDRSMITEQLSLGEELDRIDYLLRGYSLERDKDTGDNVWLPPKDNEMIILSEYGVHLIRNTIAWYLNKNTLLSNYDDKTILTKMEDFASDLNDTIFMEYEKVFQYPTLEDCKKIFDERIKRKKDLRVYTMELLGKNVDDINKTKIEKEIIIELEPVIERELDKIKEQIIKNKLKRFMLIIREIQDAIHSTYLRAWKGQERTTLRQHITISETKGGFQMQPVKTGGPLSFLRKK